jgi:hypothetical protein
MSKINTVDYLVYIDLSQKRFMNICESQFYNDLSQMYYKEIHKSIRYAWNETIWTMTEFTVIIINLHK